MPELPDPAPIARTLGITQGDITDTTYTTYVVPTAAFNNELGTTSGGFLSTVLDDTMGALVCATVLSHFAMTIEISIKFHKFVKPGDKLTIVAKIISSDETSTLVEGTIFRGTTIVASASGKWKQRRPKKGVPDG